MRTSEDKLLRTFEKALEEGHAALFAGAGLSRPAGFVDWKALLRDVASELGLDVDQETDLVAIAQYHVNAHGGRGRLNQLLIDEFTKDSSITENHRLLARLPIGTVWTTNYDRLLEDAWRDAHKRVDIKIRSEQFANYLPKRDAVIYKMHGDVEHADEAVLTKEDYEIYQNKRSLFSMQLQGDLISKTFVFLGFSFTDPNIDYVLARIRGLMGTNRREHFCVMKEPDRPKRLTGQAKAEYEYQSRKLELRIQDLQRYGVQAVLVPSHDRITDLLRELNRRSYRKNFFVSGSAADFDPLGQARLEGLARRLGKEIIVRGYNLTSGFGLGVGGAVILGAIEEVYRKPTRHLDERTTLRPFPLEPPTTMKRAELWTRYREEMIANTGFTIFLAGNKLEGGRVVLADGCDEEFEISRRLGKYPIPIGATGSAAREIWRKVVASLETLFPGKASEVAPHFDVLGDAAATDDAWIDALFAIVDAVRDR